MYQRGRQGADSSPNSVSFLRLQLPAKQEGCQVQAPLKFCWIRAFRRALSQRAGSHTPTVPICPPLHPWSESQASPLYPLGPQPRQAVGLHGPTWILRLVTKARENRSGACLWLFPLLILVISCREDTMLPSTLMAHHS